MFADQRGSSLKKRYDNIGSATTLKTAFAEGKLLKEGENWFFVLPL